MELILYGLGTALMSNFRAIDRVPARVVAPHARRPPKVLGSGLMMIHGVDLDFIAIPPETRAGAAAISEVSEVSEVSDFYLSCPRVRFFELGHENHHVIMFEGTASRMENH